MYFIDRTIHKFKIPTKCGFNLINVCLIWKSMNSSKHKHIHHHETTKCCAHNFTVLFAFYWNPFGFRFLEQQWQITGIPTLQPTLVKRLKADCCSDLHATCPSQTTAACDSQQTASSAAVCIFRGFGWRMSKRRHGVECGRLHRRFTETTLHRLTDWSRGWTENWMLCSRFAYALPLYFLHNVYYY